MSAIGLRFAPALRRARVIALLVMLAGCQTTGGAGTDVGCDAFMPLSWSKTDTIGTAKGVREHNAAWNALCAAPDVHG